MKITYSLKIDDHERVMEFDLEPTEKHMADTVKLLDHWNAKIVGRAHCDYLPHEDAWADDPNYYRCKHCGFVKEKKKAKAGKKQ